jgi:uracil-DNA glycosylase
VIDTSALAPGWRALVDGFFASDDGLALLSFLQQRECAGTHVFPPRPLRALELTPASSVRVVIVGQDPYHGAGQAHGLAFSVPGGVPLPPSLRNIYTELAREYGSSPRSGDLEPWAQQGVLLLNAVLTVEEGQPGSHANHGWERLTDSIVAVLGVDLQPRVFMLWGAHAQRARALIRDDHRHLLLTANHPSPLSARRGPQPFIGCGHFSQANDFLRSMGEEPIDWIGAEHGAHA